MLSQKVKYICKNCGWLTQIRWEWRDLKPKRCGNKKCNTSFLAYPDKLEVNKPKIKKNKKTQPSKSEHKKNEKTGNSKKRSSKTFKQQEKKEDSKEYKNQGS